MVKDIVVNLGLGERDPAGDFAIALAQTFEAHVVGIVFSYEPVIPGTVMGGIPPEFIETQRAEADKKGHMAARRFEAKAKREGVSAEHRILTESIAGAADQFERIGRRFDLVVVGQPDRENTTPGQVINEGVLFGSGRPVLFVPYIQKGPPKLDNIMICWDGSRAAARASADAMPILKKAGRVEIVIVGKGQAKDDELPGADLGEHLARHGLRVEVKRLTSPEIDVGSTILSYAADSNADLIVMGGYGHSRWREFILGGVTRGLLESMTVPVLMSH